MTKKEAMAAMIAAHVGTPDPLCGVDTLIRRGRKAIKNYRAELAEIEAGTHATVFPVQARADFEARIAQWERAIPYWTAYKGAAD